MRKLLSEQAPAAPTSATVGGERLVLGPRDGPPVAHGRPLLLDPLVVLPPEGAQVGAQGVRRALGTRQRRREVVRRSQQPRPSGVACGSVR